MAESLGGLSSLLDVLGPRSKLRIGPLILALLLLLQSGCLSMKHRNPLDPDATGGLWAGPLPEPGKPAGTPMLIDDCEDGNDTIVSGKGGWWTDVPFWSGSTITPNEDTPSAAYMLGDGFNSARSFRAYGKVVCKSVPPPFFGYALVAIEPREYLNNHSRLNITTYGSGDKPIEVEVTLKFADGDRFSTSYLLPGSWTTLDLSFTDFAPLIVVVHSSAAAETSELMEIIFAITAVGSLDEELNYDFYLDDVWIE